VRTLAFPLLGPSFFPRERVLDPFFSYGFRVRSFWREEVMRLYDFLPFTSMLLFPLCPEIEFLGYPSISVPKP